MLKSTLLCSNLKKYGNVFEEFFKACITLMSLHLIRFQLSRVKLMRKLPEKKTN